MWPACGADSTDADLLELDRTTKTLYLISLEAHASSGTKPHKLLSWRSGDASSLSEPLWMGADSIGYVNTTHSHSAVWSMHLPLPAAVAKAPRKGTTVPRKVLELPTAASSLKFLPAPGKDASGGVLAFSAHVWRGASIEQTEARERAYAEREDGGWVFDDLYIR